MDLLSTLSIELIQPPAGLRREIVFAIRRDGQQGSGTSEDLYNGSSAVKFSNIDKRKFQNNLAPYGGTLWAYDTSTGARAPQLEDLVTDNYLSLMDV